MTAHLVSSSIRVACSGALTLGLGLGLLTGCGNGVESSSSVPDATDSAGPSGSATPTPTQSSSGVASPTDDSDAGSTGAAGSGTTSSPTSSICTKADLRVTDELPAGNGGGTAGSVYILLSFENTSSTTCFMSGHPGVSFVGGGNGTQLGRPATFIGPVERVRVVPGGAVRAQLRIASPGPYGDDCAPVRPDGLRIYPPDSRASVFVAETSLQACSKNLPGGRSQLGVTAVGATA